MRSMQHQMTYEEPMDVEIFEAYMNKNARARRSDIRRVRRALRKLTAASSRESGWTSSARQ